eukprot:gene19509-25405_t
MGNCKSTNKEIYTETGVIPAQTTASIHNGSILGLCNLLFTDLKKKNIASCSDDGKIAFISGSSSLVLSNYCTGHTKAVNRLACSNKFLYSVSRDLSLKQWNSESNCVSTVDNIHSLNPSGVAVLSNDEYVVTGRSEDLCVRIWDIRSNSYLPVATINDYTYFPLCNSFDSSGNYLATGCKGFNNTGCEVKVFDLRKSNQIVKNFIGSHDQDVTGCRFISDNNVISVSKDGLIMLWDIMNDSNDNITSTNTGKILTSIIVTNASGKEFVVGSFDGSLSYYRLENNNFSILSSTSPYNFDK